MKLDALPSLGRSSPLERYAPADGPALAGPAGAGGFERVLDQFLGNASRSEAAANEAVQALAAGEAEDVHSVALAVVQADLSFRLALETRNKLQDAYQEITRLSI